MRPLVSTRNFQRSKNVGSLSRTNEKLAEIQTAKMKREEEKKEKLA